MTSRKVFVPLTDELLYDHPELITAPIRPYRTNEPCYHWLSVEVEPNDHGDRENFSGGGDREQEHMDAA